MTPQHTVGPWEPSYDRGSTRDIFSPSGPICVVRIAYVTHAEYHANARLIAAAPTMFDALVAAETLLGRLGQKAPESDRHAIVESLRQVRAALMATTKSDPKYEL